jgi:hypothetical protein
MDLHTYPDESISGNTNPTSEDIVNTILDTKERAEIQQLEATAKATAKHDNKNSMYIKSTLCLINPIFQFFITVKHGINNVLIVDLKFDRC